MKVPAPVSTVAPVADRAVNPRETVGAVRPQGEEDQKQEQLSKADAEQLAEKMSAAAELFNKAVQFKVFEGNRIIIKVINSTTGEVLSEFPPERLLEALRSIEASLGLLIDKKV